MNFYNCVLRAKGPPLDIDIVEEPKKHGFDDLMDEAGCAVDAWPLIGVLELVDANSLSAVSNVEGKMLME